MIQLGPTRVGTEADKSSFEDIFDGGLIKASASYNKRRTASEGVYAFNELCRLSWTVTTCSLDLAMANFCSASLHLVASDSSATLSLIECFNRYYIKATIRSASSMTSAIC